MDCRTMSRNVFSKSISWPWPCISILWKWNISNSSTPAHEFRPVCFRSRVVSHWQQYWLLRWQVMSHMRGIGKFGLCGNKCKYVDYPSWICFIVPWKCRTSALSSACVVTGLDYHTPAQITRVSLSRISSNYTCHKGLWKTHKKFLKEKDLSGLRHQLPVAITVSIVNRGSSSFLSNSAESIQV